MKYINKRILSILLIIAGYSIVRGQSVTDSITIYYVLHSDSTASITSIPPQLVDSMPVLFIKKSYDCADGIELQESFKIADIQYSVSCIETNAFREKNITSITIPNSVTDIGSDAFRECRKLISCDFGNTQRFINIDDNAFYNSGIQYVYGNRHIDVLRRKAFYRCENLRFINDNIIIHEIGSDAFKECNQLKKAPLQEGLEEIHSGAFSDCKLLDTVFIPHTVKNIYGNPFNACPSLSCIVVDPRNSIYDSRDSCNAILIKISTYRRALEYNKTLLVAGCSKTRIPSSVDIIGPNAFEGSGIETINIPYGVQIIRERAFSGCMKLSAIQLPNSVTSIDHSVFKDCTNLKSIILSESLTEIPNRCFANCNTLQYVYIPEGIVEIDYGAFNYCRKLGKIVIQGSIKNVYESAFHGCNGLVIYTSDIKPFKSILKYNYGDTEVQVKLILNDDLRYYNPYPIYFHYCFSKAQQKSPYESDAMWQARINNSDRTQATIDKIRNDYIVYHTTKNPPRPQIGRYNADLEMFPIIDEMYGKIRLSVPYEDWQYVKANWNKAKIESAYEIIDDKIVCRSMTVTMQSNKVYSSL